MRERGLRVGRRKGGRGQKRDEREEGRRARSRDERDGGERQVRGG